MTNAIFNRSKSITEYKIVDAPDVDLGRLGTTEMNGMTIKVIDPVTDYAELMQSLFDFDAIRKMFAAGFTLRFDAMHAVCGPYATRIMEGMLGAPKEPLSTISRWKISVDTILTRIRSMPKS